MEARRFYTKAVNHVWGGNKGGVGWSDEEFEAVHWTALAQAIKNRPEGFELWLSNRQLGSAPHIRTQQFRIFWMIDAQIVGSGGRITCILTGAWIQDAFSCSVMGSGSWVNG